MLRFSAILALLGLVLVVASALPWATWARDEAAPRAGDAAYGQQLFSAKGCAQCHHHAAVPGSGKYGGGYPGAAPDLTNRPGDPEYQRAWLRDPQALKPATAMPNLGLSDGEIDALVAFLHAGDPSPSPR
ncbi:MAG: c-type cytochrome [Thermomicrobiales bacterium]